MIYWMSWLKIPEPQKMHFKEKIRPWELGVGHQDRLKMLPNGLRTLEGWPLHTQDGISLQMLFCPLFSSLWRPHDDSRTEMLPDAVALPEKVYWSSLTVFPSPPLRAPEASSLDLEGELILMSLATEHNSMGLSLPPLTTWLDFCNLVEMILPFVRLQCSEVWTAHWAGCIVIKEGNASQR